MILNRIIFSLFFLCVGCAPTEFQFSRLNYSTKFVSALISKKALDNKKPNSPIIGLSLQIFGSSSKFCTAAVISNKYAITAAHCLKGFEAGAVFAANEKGNLIVEVKAVAGSSQTDVGIITGDFSSFMKFRFPRTAEDLMSMRLGELVSCGFPMAGSMLCSKVKLNGTRLFSINGEGNLYPGMSGGPLFDLNSMTVIGVNSSVTEDGSSQYGPLINLVESFSLDDL